MIGGDTGCQGGSRRERLMALENPRVNPVLQYAARGHPAVVTGHSLVRSPETTEVAPDDRTAILDLVFFLSKRARAERGEPILRNPFTRLKNGGVVAITLGQRPRSSYQGPADTPDIAQTALERLLSAMVAIAERQELQ